MEKSIYVQTQQLGNFYWTYNDAPRSSITVNGDYNYASKYDLERLNPDVSFNFTVAICGNSHYDNTSVIENLRDDWGFNVLVFPTDYDDTWTINNVDYKVRRNGINLFIRRATDVSYANEVNIICGNSRTGTTLPMLCGCYFENNFEITYIGLLGALSGRLNSLTFTASKQPQVSNSGTSPTLIALLHEIFDNATPTPTPPTPVPVPTDAGRMWMSNTASLSYYHFTYNNFSELRRALWARNFLDLFSQYNNKASLIPVCHIYPIKIYPFESYTSEIIIGDGETISTECFALNVEQDLGDDNRTLIAHFTLSEYPKLNNYIDYPTVTEYKLFLPFIGFINIDFQYLNKGLDIYYFLDYSTGYAVCNINSGGIRINEIDIQLAQEIILAGGDNSAWKQSVWGVVGAVAGLGVMAVTGNVLASTATYSGIKTISTVQQEPVVSKEIKQYHGGNQLSRKETLYKGNGTQTIVREEQPHTVKYTHGLTPYYLARSVNAFSDLAAMEQGITVNSSTNPNSFFNSYIHPYLLIRRPTTNIDINKFRKLEGQPLNDVRRLIDITGYTEVGNIHVDIDAYEEEISEISELLMGGVIINAH